MTTPARIQRRRTRGWRAEDHTTNPLGVVYVGRGTRWGNPWGIVRQVDGMYGIPDPSDHLATWSTFTYEAEARAEAVRRYEGWLAERPELAERARRELAGRDLMCWCPLPAEGQPDHCHAALLLALANQPATATS